MSTLARPGAAHLLTAFVEDALRLAQAYVTGERDVEGDLAEGLRTMWAAQRERGPRPPRPTSTDRAVISHHYDLSNDFYGPLLDETMAYSCGYWASDEPGFTAVTLAREQAAHVRGQVRERGLAERVEVVCRDYRDIQGGGYDAVSTVEMGEHVGDAGYPAFAAALNRLVWPCGWVLVQRMSRGPGAPGGGAFIEACIAPDMHMRPLGETRVWRLYLVGAALAFEEGRMGVDQILAVRPGPAGAAGMPSTSSAWYEDL
ncbi:class I SAM-dependent methyltransferase [Streptomyces acidiscabies]|uniref:class I SAM-dependent methyltransferase n=1 Tax=Streptomyces acidiscabies TaxID=42234 RepID=UPI00096266AE|nr:class I SAM-dependent methyltransferase [Streptomyces acidiscabies]GAV37133.1 cyclopropane fatty acyl phospholipid synthase [Streptomyces acidiscabies]